MTGGGGKAGSGENDVAAGGMMADRGRENDVVVGGMMADRGGERMTLLRVG